MPKQVAAADAVQAMLEHGTRPAEPFPGTQQPWRCECLTCGEESKPRYNDVVNKGTGACNRTCRSKKIAAKLRRNGAEAAAEMRKHGWEPLDEYPGAGKSWRSRCLECGAIKNKRLSHVQQGNGGCTSCSGRDITDAAAREVMIAADLEPRVGFPGALRPWLCRCMRCGHLGSPCYSKVRMRGHQCWSCRSLAIADSFMLDSQEAISSMLQRQLEPLESYPGSVEVPWRSRCMVCDTVLEPGPRLHSIRAGQGGCPTCAQRGINPARPGYLYLVAHNEYGALKWGIANIEQRLNQHVSQGWSLLARWDFDLVRDAWEIEREIKSWVRGQGYPYAVSADQMKYRGHTETVLVDDVSPAGLQDYVAQLVGRQPDEQKLTNFRS